MEKGIDVVYILGNGSQWQDNELRLSLRSLQENVSGIGKVFLIGHKPAFINDNVIHIPYKDVFSNKARNIMSKVYRAAGDERLSEKFMFWNDDYFAMKPFKASNYPYYYKCDLRHSVMINRGEYKLHCEATMKVLLDNNLAIKNFDCHYPIIYHKGLLREMIDKFDWETKYGYILRSMYCNFWGISGEMKQDCKTNTSLPAPHIHKQVEGNHFLSLGENGLNAAMKEYLKKRFPIKSIYEL